MKNRAVIALILAFAVTLSGCSERQNEGSDTTLESNGVSSTDIGESNSDKKIGHELALISALRHVGFTESQVTRVKSRLERDDKGVYVYSVEFAADGHLYEFDIDARSADVIEYVLDGEVIDGAGNNSNIGSEERITEDEAKTIALKHAKLSESAVTFTEVKLGSENGAWVYDVEFKKDSDKYNYTIDAVTGVIINFLADKPGSQSSSSVSVPVSSSSSKPQSSSSKPQSSKPQSTGEPQSSSKPVSSSKPQSSTQNITEDQAKDIAVKHAKLLVENISFKEVKTKTDKGVLVYDIEFVTADTEYEYTIDAATGDIIECSSEKIDTASDPRNDEKISESQAKDTAAVHAGLSAGSVTFTDVKLELDNDVWVYEIEFVSGDTEYKYKINAVTGEIMEHSSEKITQSQPESSQITEAQAKEAALKHSGAAADKAVFTEVKLDDGSKYKIKFTADGFEYEYEINASDGSVIKSEKEKLPA